MGEMIPSVQERKRNLHSFMKSYPNLCRLQNTIPHPNIKIGSTKDGLDFIGDRLKLDDWKPLLEAISNDRSLHFINIRSRHFRAKVLQEVDSENHARQIGTPKSSPLFTHYILVKIAEALSKCLRNSSALTGLLLEKIPLNSVSLSQLAQGLEVAQNLQHLSLPYTHLGDDECASLCHVLRRRLSLVWLNLTGCDLTDKGVGVLCNLLKFQKLNRYGESWKQSLRYRSVNHNVMPGLRRLTLNHNAIGDAGVKIFVENLVDDLWLKALDLQHCGVTQIGGEELLKLVKENHCLAVVDIRGNTQVSNNLVAEVVQQLSENNRDTSPDFQWLNEDISQNGTSSNSGRSISRSLQRLTSNSTLSSKGLSVLSILPNKTRFAQSPGFRPLSSRTRSTSAKRIQTTNNSPRPPWNWNYSNPSLRRGISDQLVLPHKKQNRDILSELTSVKEQLQEVSRRLEEETEKRVKLEQKLEKYKQSIEELNCSEFVNKSTLKTIFDQYYSASFTKDSSKLPQHRTGAVEDEPEMRKHDSLECIIRTINGDTSPGLELKLNKCNFSTIHSSDSQNNVQDRNSKAQLLFETLISN